MFTKGNRPAASTALLTCLAFTAGAAPQPSTPCDMQLASRVMAQCTACHSVDKGAAHATGPNLHGVIGRPIGKVKGFNFSSDLRNAKGRWDEESLAKFLADPATVYPSTRMAFGGLQQPEERQAVLCYLGGRNQQTTAR